MTGRTQQIILHITGCVVFLALPFLFSPESLNVHAYLTNPPTQRDIITYILLLGAFYFNFYLLIPRLYFQRKYLLFIAINLLCLTGIIFLPSLLVPRHNLSEPVGFLHMIPRNRTSGPNGAFPDTFDMPPPPGFQQDPSFRPDPGQQQAANPQQAPGMKPDTNFRPDPNHQPDPGPVGAQSFQPDNRQTQPAPRQFLPRGRPDPALYFIQNHRMPPIRFILDEHFFLFLVILFLALLIKIRDRWVRAEDEKLHAELAYLKSQINPHFLFNTLNSIYWMALGKSDQTAGAIVSLSSMMRYVLDETGREKVALTKEIAYITNYIQLQQTRFEGSLQVDLSVNGKPEAKTIAPLLLIPFVENAFKYGVNPEEPSTIGIRIDIGENDFRLKVTNNKVAVVPLDATPSGLGIHNTRRRLELLYPGRHTLEIQDEPKTFTVLLYLMRL